jgi:hypothetical protein
MAAPSSAARPTPLTHTMMALIQRDRPAKGLFVITVPVLL